MDQTIIIPHDAASMQPEEYHDNASKRQFSSLFSLHVAECTSISSDDDEQLSSKRIRGMTEDEKRANHTASEQRRRNIVREALNDMTQLVPGLDPSLNKSTILFKAADYINCLQSRNCRLQERLAILQRRAGYSPQYPSINVPTDEA